ncbi:MAG: MerR family transcriptional regulator [Alphaproteobacteria bacterium]|nr:MerR family transcriptional regulator [Alphaproteobacteria bacterium]MBV9693680.1 MerR family transcriptional regulator [Alphaproteobacteria bacterium]
MREAHLSPAEASRRLGVSAKALRVYESRGLVTPLRTEAGWRTYGPAQFARLHQVVALKRLGLPLARIAEILHGPGDALARVLELQERVLTRERLKLDKALSIVRTARTKLEGGSTLSVEDLTTLMKETAMTGKASPEEMQAIFDPLSEKYFSAEERAMLRQRSFDQADVSRNWELLIEEAKALMAKGDPTSPAAQDLARRWRAQVQLFTQGDPEVDAKVLGMWKDAMANPDTATKLPLNPEILAFVQKAAKGRE